MVYNDKCFLNIREEYPNLDREVRSLLLTHAQDGATISEIIDDYHKLTGDNFPISENITDYFLSIPNVMAYCTEHGTKVFNILPLDKTRHLYDMILTQKAQNKDVINSHQSIQSKSIKTISSVQSNYLETQNGSPNLDQQNYTKAKGYCNQKRINCSFSEIGSNLEIGMHSVILDSNSNYTQSYHHENINRNLISSEIIKNCSHNLDCKQQYRNFSIVDKKNFSQLSEVKTKEISNTSYSNENNADINKNHSQSQQKQLSEPIAVDEKKQEQKHQQYLQSVQQKQQNFSQKLQDMHQYPSFYSSNRIKSNKIFQRKKITPLKRLQDAKNIKAAEIDINCRNRIGMMYANQTLLDSHPIIYKRMNNHMDSDYVAHFLDFLLLGDDFFLYMARMELGCKFYKNQSILQSGLCVSGQTIRAAIERINKLSYSNRYVIVNIGSVDIMQGQCLIKIEHEFRELIRCMMCKGLTPILTTLAPLANYIHNSEVRNIIMRFNEFIKRESERCYLIIIDIWRCLVNDKLQTLFDCYQTEPRIVTGTIEPYVFWNKIGRQRVLHLIESYLEY